VTAVQLPLLLIVDETLPTFGTSGIPDREAATWLSAGSFFSGCAAVAGPPVPAGAAVVTLAWIVGCAVATPFVATVQGQKAPDAQSLTSARASAEALVTKPTSGVLRESIMQAAQRTGAPLALDGTAAGGELRVAVKSVELRGDTRASRSNPPINLVVTLDVAVANANGSEQRRASIPWSSGPYTLRDWLQDGGVRLRAALEATAPALGEAAVDWAYFFCPLPYRGSAEWSPEFAGLQAELPRPYAALFSSGPPVVDTLTPTLRWESFPRVSDHAAAAVAMQGVREVSYEVLLIRRTTDGSLHPSLRRSGLTSTELVLDRLEAGSDYFWSVRAHYVSGGRSCVTEWAARSEPSLAPPGTMGFPFRTPPTGG
jgi:hypothetical protein